MQIAILRYVAYIQYMATLMRKNVQYPVISFTALTEKNITSDMCLNALLTTNCSVNFFTNCVEFL